MAVNESVDTNVIDNATVAQTTKSGFALISNEKEVR